ncbi:hypothetical protein C7H19_19595 [Aphanothece hegewaldii CCALA 016]|uniref:DUF559 domain-containing protein n=1 Tax=Aphanothece hegewaldii CCALA 016 TaxID=2107694 RepID=A0A2T1LTE7_9CHRO|nr:hypothetical protein [Aphanothece hegewaldii]PSF33925.1 hypothetical protein C7H19_19595 [Aphanothece hegewaldii CCALA 016]
MEHYPLIFIPDAIERVKPQIPASPSLVRPQPPIKPSRPDPLTPEPQPVRPVALFLRLAIALGVSSLFGYLFYVLLNPNWGLIVGGSLGVIFLIIITLWTLSDRRDFGRRKQRHEQLQRTHLLKMAEYQQQMIVFNQQHQQYEGDLSVYNQAIIDWQSLVQQSRIALLRMLEGTETYEGKDSEAWRGQSEKRFESYLKSYFPGRIYTGLTIHRYKKEYPYTPDFVYIDKQSNLHIDIEIDEPYGYKTGQPIHYVGLEKDDERNEFFLDRLWIVIRFSEEQVIRSPKSCCKAIAQVIADVMGGELPAELAMVSSLQPCPRWTYEEAAQMAAQDYRSRYL